MRLADRKHFGRIAVLGQRYFACALRTEIENRQKNDFVNLNWDSAASHYVKANERHILVQRYSGGTNRYIYLTDSGIKVGQYFWLICIWSDVRAYLSKPGNHTFYGSMGSSGYLEAGYDYKVLRIGATEWVISKYQRL